MNGPKKRGIRYRFVTSMLAGVLLVMVLAYIGAHHHGSTPMPARGGALAAVGFGLVMFVVWSIGSAVRRAGERARERERAAGRPAGRRGRGYGYGR